MSLDAMKQALEALEDVTKEHGYARGTTLFAITVLRAAIKQAQEPVAWMYHGIRHDDTPHERPSLIWKPEYMDVMSAEKGAKATPLYTASRQWQRLTRSEITAIELSLRQYHDGDRYDLSLADFANAIEAKLKEKNNG